jgi:hypothetical protein
MRYRQVSDLTIYQQRMPKKHRKNKEWCLAEDEKQRTQQNNIVM